MPHRLLPFKDALKYISYKHEMHEPIRHVLDHKMNDSSFGMVQRFLGRELCESKFTPIVCFCND